MKALLLVILILVLIGGGMKLAGMQLPILDFPVGPLGPHVNLTPGSLRGGDNGNQIVIPLH
ncbi:MAG: hypothetical protein ACM3ML_26455 [Micromonosporaceae bacterium]